MYKLLVLGCLAGLLAEGYVVVSKLDAFLDRELSYQRKIYLELVNISQRSSDKDEVGRGSAQQGGTDVSSSL